MSETEQKGKWYVLQTLSGQEKKAYESISHQLEEKHNQNESFPVYEASLPSERVSELRNGKKQIHVRRLFPGYIFVRMDLYNADGTVNDDCWYFIRNIQGIIGFIGGGERPAPLTESEVADIFRDEAAGEQVKPKVVFEIGEVVRIKSGAFENFEGAVDEIDNDRCKLKLMVSIFGRSTPVELEFWQVDRDL